MAQISTLSRAASISGRGSQRWFSILIAIALGITVVAGVVLVQRMNSTGSFAETTTLPAGESRLDDYGLRHPAPALAPAVAPAAPAGESRLDDYGLRHPAPAVAPAAPAGDSRLDDYGLRHP